MLGNFLNLFSLVSVAKPLVADGSAKSHELSLAYDRYSLRKLEPPLVLQEFVNHGMCFMSCMMTCGSFMVVAAKSMMIVR